MTSKQDIDAYMLSNRSDIEDQILELLENSDSHYFINMNNMPTPNNFYLYGDTVIVTDQEDNTIVTVYRCDYNMPGTINTNIVSGLKKEIKYLEKSLQEAELQVKKDVDIIDTQVRSKEQEMDVLLSKAEQLKKEVSTAKSKIAEIRSKPSAITREIEFRISQLVSSLSFTRDMSSSIRIGGAKR